MPASLFKNIPPNYIWFLEIPTKNGASVIDIFSIGVRVIKPLNSSSMIWGSMPYGNIPKIPLPTTTITSSMTWISLIGTEYLKYLTKLYYFLVDL